MDPHDLKRFLDAQEGAYSNAIRELRDGRKRSHWMWFVFPQVKGLGSSSNAEFYGIGSMDEARAYLAHPVLGQRLEEVTRLMLDLDPKTPHDVLGSPDDLKFRSSMTLFAHVAGPRSIFRQALDSLCGGIEDVHTVTRLQPPRLAPEGP